MSLKKIDFGLVVSYDQALEIYRDIFKTTQVTEQVTKYFYMIDLEDLEYFYYDTVKMKLKDRVIDFLKEYTQNVESYEMLRNYRYNQRLTNEQKLYIDNKFPYPMNYQIKKIMNFIICACVVISRLVSFEINLFSFETKSFFFDLEMSAALFDDFVFTFSF